MRRRQVYAAQAAGIVAPVIPVVGTRQATPLPRKPPRVSKPEYKAGICPYCGKDMKRGSYMHIRMHEKHGHQRLG